MPVHIHRVTNIACNKIIPNEACTLILMACLTQNFSWHSLNYVGTGN